MMKKHINWFAAVAILFSAHAFAGDVTVKDAWSRATAPGQENGSVGLVITSAKEARLIAVTSPAAGHAEIHTMSMDDGVMRMRQLEDLPLPANTEVKLGPGGNHLMLFDLKKPLKAGDTFSVTATIQFADKSTKKITFKAEVRSMSGSHEGHHMHH